MSKRKIGIAYSAGSWAGFLVGGVIATVGFLITPFVQNPWRYLSKHTDRETGFVFFGRRYYDPSQGRFLTRDPKGYTDSLNLYTYALNDPFTRFDPFGLENEPTDLTAITTGGIQGTVEGAWQGFMHPMDSLHHMASDITAFGNSILAGNFSTLLAAWKSMDPEEKARFCMTRVAQVGGVGASVYFLGGPILNGVKASLSMGRVALSAAFRMTRAEVVSTPVIETISPYAVRFSQPTISQNFSNGKNINELIQGLRSGKIGVNDIPVIRVIEIEGKLITLDNRRLAAFQNAKIDSIPIKRVYLDNHNIAIEFENKFNPINNGGIIDMIPKSSLREIEENFLRTHGKIK